MARRRCGALGFGLLFACGALGCGQDESVAPDAPGDGPKWGFCEANDEPFPVRATPSEPASLPWLRVEATDVVDENGSRVGLRGVNFGSWMMMETWIAGIGVLDEGELLELVPQKAAEFGVSALIEEARATNALDWLIEKKSHWKCIQEWRTYSYEHATAEQKPGLDRFWGWFDSEPWIFEERSLWNWLWKRFGHESMQELRATFRDHYITELDVERAAALGMNLIRVPVWFEALEGDYVGDAGFKPDGWAALDRISSWARKHRIYLMLDLHGAPGGQSTSWHQGLEVGGVIWSEPRCIDKTARLWQAMASYFADDPHVAVYDLLNEPISVPGADAYREVHDALYRSIREVDTKHIVMSEDGYRAPSQFVSPKELGWQNAMFSVHFYPGGTSAEDYLRRTEDSIAMVARYWERFACPLFIGEFNGGDDAEGATWAVEASRLTFERFNERGLHWAPWTWKYYAENTTWGVYHPSANPGHRIDVRDASFEEIRAEFEALDSQNFEALPDYAEALRANARGNFATQDLGTLPP